MVTNLQIDNNELINGLTVYLSFSTQSTIVLDRQTDTHRQQQL